MPGMGPAPKPESQQRRRGRGLAAGATTRLPAGGREGSAPDWPLSRPSAREAQLWERLWRTPQSVMWERLGWADVVARYTRQLTVAERRKPPVAVLAEVRQLEDRLGLTPMAMLRLRWEISDESTEVSEGGTVIGIRSRVAAVDD